MQSAHVSNRITIGSVQEIKAQLVPAQITSNGMENTDLVDWHDLNKIC